jgi:hypothetical protein
MIQPVAVFGSIGYLLWFRVAARTVLDATVAVTTTMIAPAAAGGEASQAAPHRAPETGMTSSTVARRPLPSPYHQAG